MFMRNRISEKICRPIAKKLYKKNQKFMAIPHSKIERQFCRSSNVFWSQNFANQKIASVGNIVPVNKFTQRSHTCGELRIENVGEDVQLCGWVEFQRLGKFIILRDGYGSTQLIIPENRQDLSKLAKDITSESVLTASGRVLKRPEGQENPTMKTGRIEVMVESLEILNYAKPRLPFSLREFNKAKEQLQMQYRYLALRFPELQRNLRLRSQLVSKMREYLINQCGFVDIETPTLFRRTPGGAKEFVVPTRVEGKFYSLVQSPQQFKQLLMIGGFDRYFQIARCYRDEGSRSDRQPEFTQLDIEMSFTDREKILHLIEELITYCWFENLNPAELSFPRLTYAQAMEKYGTDAPDLRIPYELQNLTELVEPEFLTQNQPFGAFAIVFPQCSDLLTKSIQEQLREMCSMYSTKTKVSQIKVSRNSVTKLSRIVSENVAKNLLQKLQVKEGDVIFFAFGAKLETQRVIGKLRVEFTNSVEAKGKSIRCPDFKFLWVLDFPLFSLKDDGSLESNHHPFTQPHPDDIQYLASQPAKVRGLHYDLVLNGAEIGGGSIRIHESKLQTEILKMLKIETDQLKHLIEALDCGAPPHGGIALGVDRFVALLCKSSSIREVIAFPKTMEGRDLMAEAPAIISEEEKRLYHLK